MRVFQLVEVEWQTFPHAQHVPKQAIKNTTSKGIIEPCTKHRAIAPSKIHTPEPMEPASSERMHVEDQRHLCPYMITIEIDIDVTSSLKATGRGRRARADVRDDGRLGQDVADYLRVLGLHHGDAVRVARC